MSSAIRVKDNLELISEKIAKVSDKKLQDYAYEIDRAKQLKLIIDIGELKEAGIDLAVSCSKTGKPLHHYSAESIDHLINTLGQERAKEILQRKQVQQVDDLWIFTDSTALRSLMINDPIGYFTYGASKILYILQDGINKRPWVDLPIEVKYIWHKQLAILYQSALDQPLDYIMECNELIRRYLSLASTSMVTGVVKFKPYTLDKILTNPIKFQLDLKASIKAIIFREFDRGTLKRFITYADIADLKIKFKGSSAYYHQHSLRYITSTEKLANDLMDSFPELDITKAYITAAPKAMMEGRKIAIRPTGAIVLKPQVKKLKPMKELLK